jgi:uncharacterized membrane protein YoaK (UPF0700 family)
LHNGELKCPERNDGFDVGRTRSASLDFSTINSDASEVAHQLLQDWGRLHAVLSILALGAVIGDLALNLAAD